jgi:hypothetical protein
MVYLDTLACHYFFHGHLSMVFKKHKFNHITYVTLNFFFNFFGSYFVFNNIIQQNHMGIFTIHAIYAIPMAFAVANHFYYFFYKRFYCVFVFEK